MDLSKITNIGKWIKILDELGVDVGDFKFKKLVGLTSGSSLDDVLKLFKNKDDVDKGKLENAIGHVGNLSSLLGDSEDKDEDKNLLGSLLGDMLDGDDDDDEGGLVGDVLDKLL